jgi:trigger factor
LKVTVERTPESEAVLNVELEWDELEKASDRAYRKLAQQYNVPGFRKGHAPRTMLERMLGKEAIYHEGLDDLIESSYREAIRDNALTPLAQPALDTPEIEMGKSYTFTARVPVLPPIALGDYTSVRVAQPDTAVTDEDIDKVLEQVRQDQAMWLPAERPAQIGDKVTMDLKLTVGDRTISDLHDNEFELAEERAGIFSGMDQQIVGMSEGDSKQFTTTIPEDYANAELAGKEANYDVTLKAVKYRELPEIDDELAKSVGDFENVAALRARVREQLTEQKGTEARRELREQALKAVTDQVTVEIHPVLLEEEVDSMLGEQRRMLEQSRLNFDQYLEMMQKTEQEYRADLEPEARERVKRDLVLDAIADAEGMQVSDTEIASWLELIAAMGGRRMRLNQLSRGQRANIAARIRRDKAAARVVEIASQEQPDTDTDTGTDTDTDTDTEASAAASEANAISAARAGAAAGEASKTESAPQTSASASSAATTPPATAIGTPATSEAEEPAAGAKAGRAQPPASAQESTSKTSKTSSEAAEAPSEAAMSEPQAEVPAPAESDV